MTYKEIAQALRCTSTPGGLHEDCTGCPYYRKEQLDAELKEKLGVDTWPSCDVNKVGMDAADLIERLTAENAEAEAERDAALADLADARNCKTCKYACDTRDCSSCKSKTCKCRECHLDKNAWEWRGLPKAQEEGKKA